MSFLDNLKKTAVETTLKAFKGYPLAVSETQLNSLAATLARSGEAPISITCLPGAIAISGEAWVAGVPLTYRTRLALEDCEISPARKVLTLRRLDNVDFGGNSLTTKLYARVVKVLLCGLFGIDPARFALQDIAGVHVEKDLITADLDAMDATEAILRCVKARLPTSLVPLLDTASAAISPRLGAGSNAMLARIGVDDIAIEAGCITGKLQIHPANNDCPPTVSGKKPLVARQEIHHGY